MKKDSRQLHLNLFLHQNGHHEASWRHPAASRNDLLSVEYFKNLAIKAEAAKMDAVFFADGLAINDELQYASRFHLEPVSIINAIAPYTQKIGFIATASTSFYEPYNLARLFGTADHLSNGRVGWNIVTTSLQAAALNYGQEHHAPHEQRYARAHEFIEAASRLWDGWQQDAFVHDAASGLYVDLSKVQAANYQGQYIKVKGRLTNRIPRKAGLYVQAGSSKDGIDFAARHAEAIFTAHQSLGAAQAFYAEVKSRAVAHGRNADLIKILPGLSPFIGSTEAEAKAVQQEFDALIQPRFSLLQIQRQLGIQEDITHLELDAEFPQDFVCGNDDQAQSSRFKIIKDIITHERPTVRALITRLASARGHYAMAGTPEQVADHIQEWFFNGAADGINVMPPGFPQQFDVFAEQVIPILQRRGLFRTEYAGDTLRSHFGLPTY